MVSIWRSWGTLRRIFLKSHFGQFLHFFEVPSLKSDISRMQWHKRVKLSVLVKMLMLIWASWLNRQYLFVPRNREAPKNEQKLQISKIKLRFAGSGKNFWDDDPQLGKYFGGAYCLAVALNCASYICIISPPGGVANVPVQKCPIFDPPVPPKIGNRPQFDKNAMWAIWIATESWKFCEKISHHHFWDTKVRKKFRKCPFLELGEFWIRKNFLKMEIVAALVSHKFHPDLLKTLGLWQI